MCPSMSRDSLRSSMLVVLVGAFGWLGLAACNRAVAPAPSSNDVRIREAEAALVALWNEEPTLPGFALADSLAINAFARRNRADGNLLVGRLYHDLARGLQDRSTHGSIDKAAIRAVLHTPRPVGRFTRAYYDSLLVQTRTRASTDLAYGRTLQQALTAAARDWIDADPWEVKCIIDDMPWPPVACRGLILNAAFF